MAIYTPADSSELAAITTVAGDTVLLRTGVTYAASSVPATLLTPNNITIGVIGTGPKPIISGGTTRADWAFDAPNNVYSRPALGGNTLGNVTEDGVPMKFVAWNTNIATTAAAMNAGQSLPKWSGSMTYDPATNIVYIRPSAGAPSGHVYVVSEQSYGFQNNNTNNGLQIDGIDIRHISRHGILLINKKNLKISNCSFWVMGGIKPASLWLGNGIELNLGVQGAEVTDCQFDHIFDSAATSQIAEAFPATIGSHLWQNITAARCGLHVVEINALTNYQTVQDIEIANIVSVDHGDGWSGDRSGAVVSNLAIGSVGCSVQRSFARNVNGVNQRRLYLGFKHRGICGIEDSQGVGSRTQGPRADSNGAGPQRDLMRNVVDNLARSGDSWVDSTASMRDHFRPVFV